MEDNKPVWVLGDSNPKKIEDHYKLTTEELGRGTYGKVMKTHPKKSNCERAIKVIPKSKVSNFERFKSEVEIMKKLDHPNILRIYESYEDETNIYLVLEQCEGGELFDRIIAKNYYDEKGARRIFRQIVKSILYCHAKGVCHRDLKPENFLFLGTEDESLVKLIDFGLSKNFTHGGLKPNPTQQQSLSPGKPQRRAPKTNMKTRAGTPFYIAPEVLTGNYDEKCDVWSAGVILYILLCGYPPFYGETNKEILEQVKKGKQDFSGPEWKGKTENVFNLILKMICHPNERYSAKQVLEHPWMKIRDDLVEVTNDQLKKVFNNMNKHAKFPKLAKLNLYHLAKQFNEKEVLNTQNCAIHINKSQDGKISLQELTEVAGSIGVDKALVKKTFEALDILDKGFLSYTQFLSAAMDTQEYLKEDKLNSLFRVYDSDDDGKVSINDFTNLMNAEWSDEKEANHKKAIIKEFQDSGLNGMNLAKLMSYLDGVRK